MLSAVIAACGSIGFSPYTTQALVPVRSAANCHLPATPIANLQFFHTNPGALISVKRCVPADVPPFPCKGVGGAGTASAVSMRMALNSGSAISCEKSKQSSAQAIECKRSNSVPIQGLRQPWTGTNRRRGVGEEGRMRTSPTSPILAEICDLDEVFT